MKILVIRMSAMGDTAMTIPVIKNLLQAYPDLEIVYVSKKAFAVFFEGIDRLEFVAPDLDGKHGGLFGMYRFFNDLKNNYKFDAVADLHSVIRSSFLSTLFKLSGTKVATIDKGKSKKNQIIRRFRKRLKPIKLTTERYANVFRDLGFKIDLCHELPEKPNSSVPPLVLKKSGVKAGPWIGIAPFAQHEGKKYPFDKVGKLIGLLEENYPNSKIFLFGGGEKEIKSLKGLWSIHPRTILAAGKMNLSEELDLMANLDLMISMDSANMHMASMQGTKVVSVWGSTHPYVGFMGYGQKLEWAAQIDMDCRPCSVFGEKKCYKSGKDHYSCMTMLPESLILEKVKLIIPQVKEEA